MHPPPGKTKLSGLIPVGILTILFAGPNIAAQGGDPDLVGNGMYSLPRSQDNIAALQDARRDVDEKRFAAAVERLQALLNRREPSGVVPVPGGIDRFTGLRLAVQTTLRDLPEEGLAEYERLARREAGNLFDRAVSDLRPDELAHLATTFPTSEPGVRARIRLGDLALESGDAFRAQMHYRAALDAVPPADRRTAGLRQRQAAAELIVRRRNGSASGDTELARSLAQVVPDSGLRAWAAYGGGYDGSRPMDTPEGDFSNYHSVQVRARGFSLNHYAVHATGDLSGIYINDGWQVWAFDPVAHVLQWRAGGGMLEHDREDNVHDRGSGNQGLILVTKRQAYRMPPREIL